MAGRIVSCAWFYRLPEGAASGYGADAAGGWLFPLGTRVVAGEG
jgi:hypothetical protein